MSHRMIKCPKCGKDAIWSETNPYRPFCSERCKMIDLGAWANEEYQIAPDVNPDEEEYSTGQDESEQAFTPLRH